MRFLKIAKAAIALMGIAVALMLAACTSDGNGKDAPTGAPTSAATSATTGTSPPSNPTTTSSEPVPANTQPARPSLFDKPREFTYSVGEAVVKITLWELRGVSSMSTTHPADGSYIPKTKNADLLPFSVEVTSPNGDDKLVIAVKPRTAGGPIDFGLGEMGVVEGYGHVIRNGYLIVTAALTTPIMSQREQVEAGDISNVPMTFTIAAGPADTDSNLMPYRIFAPTSSGAVDISTYVNSDVFGYGWQTLGKRTLGECVAPWDSGWH